MRIRWHGHDCFEITGGPTIVTDPHDGRSIGITPPRVRGDIILISHDHFDHNCARMVKGSNIKIVDSPGEYNIKGITIDAISSFHDGVCGEKRGPNIIFSFRIDDISFCFLGDLGHKLDEETLERIGKVDILWVPVGGTFTIDGKTACSVISTLNPRVVIPMHYRVGGLTLPIATLDDFLSCMVSSIVSKIGNEIEFEKEDFPKETEVWIFSP